VDSIIVSGQLGSRATTDFMKTKKSNEQLLESAAAFSDHELKQALQRARPAIFTDGPMAVFNLIVKEGEKAGWKNLGGRAGFHLPRIGEAIDLNDEHGQGHAYRIVDVRHCGDEGRALPPDVYAIRSGTCAQSVKQIAQQK